MDIGPIALASAYVAAGGLLALLATGAFVGVLIVAFAYHSR